MADAVVDVESMVSPASIRDPELRASRRASVREFTRGQNGAKKQCALIQRPCRWARGPLRPHHCNPPPPPPPPSPWRRPRCSSYAERAAMRPSNGERRGAAGRGKLGKVTVERSLRDHADQLHSHYQRATHDARTHTNPRGTHANTNTHTWPCTRRATRRTHISATG